jgi:hypothetical protein
MRENLLLLLMFLGGFVKVVVGNPTDTISFSATFCDSVRWYGTSYYNDTVTSHLITHEFGDRDTLYFLDLHVNHSVNTDIYDTSCHPYYWEGEILEVSGVYVHRFSAANGCDSTLTLHLVIHPTPYMYNFVGDTFVCRNQLVEFRIEDPMSANTYCWFWNGLPIATDTTAVQVFVADAVEDEIFTLHVEITNVFGCQTDTTFHIHNSGYRAPDAVSLVRKGTSRILVCQQTEPEEVPVNYRWGYSDKATSMDYIPQPEWNQRYFQYEEIDYNRFSYWVELTTDYGTVSCRTRSYYEGEHSNDPEGEEITTKAYLQGNSVLLDVENPGNSHVFVRVFDSKGQQLQLIDCGDGYQVTRHIAFDYPRGLYLISVNAGKHHVEHKIIR